MFRYEVNLHRSRQLPPRSGELVGPLKYWYGKNAPRASETPDRPKPNLIFIHPAQNQLSQQLDNPHLRNPGQAKNHRTEATGRYADKLWNLTQVVISLPTHYSRIPIRSVHLSSQRDHESAGCVSDIRAA